MGTKCLQLESDLAYYCCRVRFSKMVKTHFIRWGALSSQNYIFFAEKSHDEYRIPLPHHACRIDIYIQCILFPSYIGILTRYTSLLISYLYIAPHSSRFRFYYRALVRDSDHEVFGDTPRGLPMTIRSPRFVHVFRVFFFFFQVSFFGGGWPGY